MESDLAKGYRGGGFIEQGVALEPPLPGTGR